MKCLMFNGPPDAGKDEASKIVTTVFPHCTALKLSKPLKEGTHASLGLQLPYDAFEHRKDVPLDSFFGLTPRQAYIKHSEEYMVKVYGEDIFGRLLVREIYNVEGRVRYPHRSSVVVSDCGFMREILPVIAALGPNNVAIVRLYRNSRDFKNDSRGYITALGASDELKEKLKGVRLIDVYNNGTLDELRKKLEIELASFMKPHAVSK